MRRLAFALLPLAAAAGTARAQFESFPTLASVPEPGSTAIFAVALAVLGLARVARLRDRA